MGWVCSAQPRNFFSGGSAIRWGFLRTGEPSEKITRPARTKGDDGKGVSRRSTHACDGRVSHAENRAEDRREIAGELTLAARNSSRRWGGGAEQWQRSYERMNVRRRVCRGPVRLNPCSTLPRQAPNLALDLGMTRTGIFSAAAVKRRSQESAIRWRWAPGWLDGLRSRQFVLRCVSQLQPMPIEPSTSDKTSHAKD